LTIEVCLQEVLFEVYLTLYATDPQIFFRQIGLTLAGSGPALEACLPGAGGLAGAGPALEAWQGQGRCWRCRLAGAVRLGAAVVVRGVAEFRGLAAVTKRGFNPTQF